MPVELQWFHNGATGATVQIPIPDGDTSRDMYARSGWLPCDPPPEAGTETDSAVQPAAAPAPETPAVTESPQATSEQEPAPLDATQEN